MRKTAMLRPRATWLLSLIFLTISSPILCEANMLGLAALGVRGGVSDSTNEQYFEQYELFTSHKLPWAWNLPAGWTFETRVNVTAGALIGGGGTAFVGTVGPEIALAWNGFSLFAGASPTYLSKEKFEVEDFGGEFQLTTHAGLSYQFFREFAVGYRIQHMSNAGIYDSNPGLNLHMFELKYLF